MFLYPTPGSADGMTLDMEMRCLFIHEHARLSLHYKNTQMRAFRTGGDLCQPRAFLAFVPAHSLPGRPFR